MCRTNDLYIVSNTCAGYIWFNFFYSFPVTMSTWALQDKCSFNMMPRYGVTMSTTLLFIDM